MHGPRKTRKSESKEEKGGNREREGECDKRHNILWDAFGQSEHLSKQGSLNGRLTNGYGRERQRGRRDGGVALAHSKRHTRMLLHAQPHKSQRHTQTQQLQLLFVACSRSHQSFGTKFLQSYTVIAIELLSCLDVRMCVFMHSGMSVSACERCVCMFTFQQCFGLSDTFHHLSLWWIGCCVNHSSELFFFLLHFFFFKAIWAELSFLSLSLSLCKKQPWAITLGFKSWCWKEMWHYMAVITITLPTQTISWFWQHPKLP